MALRTFDNNLIPRALQFSNYDDLVCIFLNKSNDKPCYIYKYHLYFPDPNNAEENEKVPTVDHVQTKPWKISKLVTLITGISEDFFGIGTSNGTVGLFAVDDLKENTIKEEIHELPCTCGVIYPTDFLNNKTNKTYDDLRYINLVTGSIDCSVQMMGLSPDMSNSYKLIFYIFGAFIFVIISVILITYYITK